MAELPALPGSYALLLRLETETVLAVGRLGRFTFPPGDYVYVGSAHGPGGLRARVRRHARSDKRKRWHIDHLRREARLLDAHAVVGDERQECHWARTLLHLPGAAVIVPGFGASDCHCLTHLAHFREGISMERLRQVLVGHPQELVENLRRAVAAQDDDACEAIAHALAVHGEGLSLLQPLLAEGDADTRWWAVRALAAAGDLAAAPWLIEALDDPDEAVRCAAALALGQLQAQEAIPALAARLADESGWVRQSAADGLALIGEAAVPALAEALQDERDGVRVRAAYALNKIRSPQAAKPLFQALNDANVLVRTYAGEALEGMGLLDVILVV
ncbi:MAG: DUF123 domain-containing protein [Anaerolineae bacterium]|nr:DUF123 domain-containing protein [Anaerolineae bacterium]